jgi:hypothetical protein
MDFESAQFYQISIYLFICAFILMATILWVGDWQDGMGTTYANLNLEMAVYMAAVTVLAHVLMTFAV